jgi:hypothetical protein
MLRRLALSPPSLSTTSAFRSRLPAFKLSDSIGQGVVQRGQANWSWSDQRANRMQS